MIHALSFQTSWLVIKHVTFGERVETFLLAIWFWRVMRIWTTCSPLDCSGLVISSTIKCVCSSDAELGLNHLLLLRGKKHGRENLTRFLSTSHSTFSINFDWIGESVQRKSVRSDSVIQDILSWKKSKGKDLYELFNYPWIYSMLHIPSRTVWNASEYLRAWVFSRFSTC